MNKKVILLSLFIPTIALAILYFMGREVICTCGYIKFWHGVVVSSENSQHLFDWYTFTHVIHGLGFFLLLYVVEKISGKRIPLTTKFLVALSLESTWEILENTDFVINRYRAATISLDYFGDSIINSLGDIIAMLAGFWIAAKKSVWLSIGLFIVIELALLWIIRDNLTINLIMLIYPIEALKQWQGAI